MNEVWHGVEVLRGVDFAPNLVSKEACLKVLYEFIVATSNSMYMKWLLGWLWNCVIPPSFGQYIESYEDYRNSSIQIGIKLQKPWNSKVKILNLLFKWAKQVIGGL